MTVIIEGRNVRLVREKIADELYRSSFADAIFAIESDRDTYDDLMIEYLHGTKQISDQSFATVMAYRLETRRLKAENKVYFQGTQWTPEEQESIKFHSEQMTNAVTGTTSTPATLVKEMFVKPLLDDTIPVEDLIARKNRRDKLMGE